ncbi:MAG: hypothetical protein E7166_01595 [Firmicutes bacterium]|nr:hypothetical protein [Bacillota bacterium]
MQLINITDKDIKELDVILNKLNYKSLYLYWILKRTTNIKELQIINDNINPILEHYKTQISKMYILNIIEQNLLNNKDTQLNMVIERLKNKLDTRTMLDEDIMNCLCLSNIDTIFNNIEDYEFDYKLIYNKNDEVINNKYLNTAIIYANSICTKRKNKKKILNII